MKGFTNSKSENTIRMLNEDYLTTEVLYSHITAKHMHTLLAHTMVNS